MPPSLGSLLGGIDLWLDERQGGCYGASRGMVVTMYILNKVPQRVRGALFLYFSVLSAHATAITLPFSFTAGSPISASQMMGNFVCRSLT